MRISIIIPVYNKNKYLNSIFDQIIRQSFSDFECVIVDDGSTDGSEKICDAYAEKDDRFKVFHIPNGGVSHARNVGLENAKGDYITFIDADDEISHNYLENLICCIEKSGADMVISGHQKFWENNSDKVENCPPVLNGTVRLKDILDSFASVQKNTGIFGWCCSKIFPNTLVADIRFDETLRLAEDFDFYLKIYKKVKLIHFDNKCLYRYRQEAENSSVITLDENIDYFAQLIINLRYRLFLKDFGKYTNDNKVILEKTLSDYLYFCVYHYPKEDLYDRVMMLAKIQHEESIDYGQCKGLQRRVLKFMAKYRIQAAVMTISIYKRVRKIIKSMGAKL